jgi:hypothetical protein
MLTGPPPKFHGTRDILGLETSRPPDNGDCSPLLDLRQLRMLLVAGSREPLGVADVMQGHLTQAVRRSGTGGQGRLVVA